MESVLTVIMRQFLVSYTATVCWAGNSLHLTAHSRCSAGIKSCLVRKTGTAGALPKSGENQGGGQHGTVSLPPWFNSCSCTEGFVSSTVNSWPSLSTKSVWKTDKATWFPGHPCHRCICSLWLSLGQPFDKFYSGALCGLSPQLCVPFLKDVPCHWCMSTAQSSSFCPFFSRQDAVLLQM